MDCLVGQSEAALGSAAGREESQVGAGQLELREGCDREGAGEVVVEEEAACGGVRPVAVTVAGEMGDAVLGQ